MTCCNKEKNIGTLNVCVSPGITNCPAIVVIVVSKNTNESS